MTKPDPTEAERELLLTMARVLRSMLDHSTPRADDHSYVDALDAAIKRVEASEVVKPVCGDAAS